MYAILAIDIRAVIQVPDFQHFLADISRISTGRAGKSFLFGGGGGHRCDKRQKNYKR